MVATGRPRGWYRKLFQVALDEASEETGLDLSIFRPVTNLLFDIDVNKIPKRGAEPAHTLYDIRYIFQIPEINLPSNDESYKVLFVPFDEVKEFNKKLILACAYFG